MTATFRPNRLRAAGACVLVVLLCGCAAEPVDYNAEIKPLLNSKCIRCHGGVKREGEFSLLFRHEALAPAASGQPAIVPGRPGASELVRRIRHRDPDERMPRGAPPLTDHEIDQLERWIEQGAPWPPHWAYVPPDPAAAPPPVPAERAPTGLDAFVVQGLDAEGLAPAPEADRPTLIRRLSLDLTGLPPTPEEVQAFVGDTTATAYEAVVDRLLADPAYGERWAAFWLDLARYGDSQGYQKDPPRSIWRYRDWVIDAFNQDMPFDRFTIEQLAGDLLPAPTTAQLLATAFHRNTMSNDEGGTDDEEFRVAAVIDRVNTTFEVWQGTTIGCVQCHSHPYDPFEHEDFYRLYAFFNNTRDADRPDEKPKLVALSPAQQRTRDALDRRLADAAHLPPAEAAALATRQAAIVPGPTPVMAELPPDSSRPTHVFERGNWLVHGEAVAPAVPASLGELAADQPLDRLGLARWLVAPENPLTARVMVNRFWAQLFGLGLVETLEDFGTEGAHPSHPALLDWLAVRFSTTHQWHMKALLKEIVTSATYRQASAVAPALVARDPRNRLLARGPRVRLTAEQLRDQALAVGGLLSRKMYGPSVMPPQPEGVWQVIRHVMRWQTSPGEDRYRRGVYTFWRKSSPYPALATFDAPSRAFCVSRRNPTNTPLQALVTLNDSTFVEAALGLADRVLADPALAGGAPAVEPAAEDAQLIRAYELALMRPPDAPTLDALRAFYRKTAAHYAQVPEAAAALLPQGPVTAERAALVNTAGVILNLDAFITKE